MRHYKLGHDGKRRLFVITCDAPHCVATLEPGPHVVTSGWTQHEDRVDDARFEVMVCPRHEQDGPAMVRARVVAHRRQAFDLDRRSATVAG